MKTLIALLCAVMISGPAFAVTKCESDGRGGMCCWDTTKDGPWKPIGC